MKTKWLWTCWWKWWWRWRWRRWRWWCGGGGGDDGGGGGGYVGYWYVLILMIDFSWQRWFWWCWWSVMTCIWGPCSHIYSIISAYISPYIHHIFTTNSPHIHHIFTTYSPTHIDNDHNLIIMTLAMGRQAWQDFSEVFWGCWICWGQEGSMLQVFKTIKHSISWLNIIIIDLKKYYMF